MALVGEVGELCEIFQWLTAEESAAVMSSPRAQDVRDELADVLMYLVRRADVLDVDLIRAGEWKDHIINEDLHVYYRHAIEDVWGTPTSGKGLTESAH